MNFFIFFLFSDVILERKIFKIFSMRYSILVVIKIMCLLFFFFVDEKGIEFMVYCFVLILLEVEKIYLDNWV